ncbi:(2Fe-2S)-binding protein [Peptoniphilus sp. SGI.035]|uniref:(2Fe-2S)-binding protein n=1 Tax=unclassified Peptoniphilus TaxID=2637196 RepID=UPI0025F36FE6|nr:(2Fe-2S)-binding protein [Peptoniphilus sp.]MCI5644086.1 (2Fe-2S)-binding protein [Peptoniphilus sp.]MDD7353108.1 (2Fe-2S)-binding protein [Peptoniphilaceae bacterium]MDY3902684.1 (2Fe-2S)-binding protein [Peptoniphilus sp.]
MKISLKVNGEIYNFDVDEKKRLIDLLRNDLRLTGTKEGCSEGECGACTVLVDSLAVTSCTMLAAQLDGKEVITIEGLEHDGQLDILQKKFVECGAVQCGYCSPGFIMSAKSLMLHNINPTTYEIKRYIEGNLCRCTGFMKILEAIEKACKEVEK